MPAIQISEERGVRYLHFGSPWVQGAMRIARPYALELEYTRDMMFPLLLHEAPWPKRVLQIGLGTASIVKFLARHRPQARQTVVEISDTVVATAYQYFRMPEESQHLRLVIGDGADFVAGKPGRFDLVIVDGYDGRGRTGQLDTASFYSNAHACMTQGGMLATNLLTRTRGVRSSVARMQGAFDGRVLPLPPSDAGNMVVIAAAGAPIAHSLADLRAAATRLRAASGLSLLSAVERAASVAEAGVLRL